MSYKTTDDWREALTWMLLPTGRAWQKAAGAAIVRPGLPFAAAASLLVIARLGDGVRQSEVAEEAAIDRAAIARSVSQLEVEGFIMRQTDTKDARAKTLHLTVKGRQVVGQLDKSLEGLRARHLAMISSEDGEAAVRVLRAISEHADDLVSFIQPI